MTAEHLIPDWAGAVLDFYTAAQKQLGMKFRLAHHRGKDRVRTSQWIADSPDLKARCVCGDCNNGWMSEIEIAAKPLLTEMIQDRAVQLDVTSQKAIATWLGLKAVVAHHSVIDPPPGSWTEQFWEAKCPPNWWHIRLGRYVGAHAATFTSSTLTVNTRHELSPFAVEQPGFLFTVAMGRFLGQVAAIDRHAAFPINRRYFVEVWPHGLLRLTDNPGVADLITTSWPPQKELDDSQLLDCAENVAMPHP